MSTRILSYLVVKPLSKVSDDLKGYGYDEDQTFALKDVHLMVTWTKQLKYNNVEFDCYIEQMTFDERKFDLGHKVD